MVFKSELLQRARKNVLTCRASSPWGGPNYQIEDSKKQLLVCKSQPRWNKQYSQDRAKLNLALRPLPPFPTMGPRGPGDKSGRQCCSRLLRKHQDSYRAQSTHIDSHIDLCMSICINNPYKATSPHYAPHTTSNYTTSFSGFFLSKSPQCFC